MKRSAERMVACVIADDLVADGRSYFAPIPPIFHFVSSR